MKYFTLGNFAKCKNVTFNQHIKKIFVFFRLSETFCAVKVDYKETIAQSDYFWKGLSPYSALSPFTVPNIIFFQNKFQNFLVHFLGIVI